jgi:hypothetical protein
MTKAEQLKEDKYMAELIERTMFELNLSDDEWDQIPTKVQAKLLCHFEDDIS